MGHLHKSGALLVAFLACSSLAHAQGGSSPTSTGPIPVPMGSTGFKFEIYDYDPTFLDPDELLESGEGTFPQPVPPGGNLDIDFKDLYCEDGVIKGPAGSSGEAEAEIYVVVKFIQPNGSVTVTTKTQTVKCSDLPPKPK